MKKTVYYVEKGQVVEAKVVKKGTREVISYRMFEASTKGEIDTVVLGNGKTIDTDDVFSTLLEAFNSLLKEQEDSRKQMARYNADSLRSIADKMSPKKSCDCDDDDEY